MPRPTTAGDGVPRSAWPTARNQPAANTPETSAAHGETQPGARPFPAPVETRTVILLVEVGEIIADHFRDPER